MIGLNAAKWFKIYLFNLNNSNYQVYWTNMNNLHAAECFQIAHKNNP